MDAPRVSVRFCIIVACAVLLLALYAGFALGRFLYRGVNTGEYQEITNGYIEQGRIITELRDELGREREIAFRERELNNEARRIIGTVRDVDRRTTGTLSEILEQTKTLKLVFDSLGQLYDAEHDNHAADNFVIDNDIGK
jgi:hypothetical protein